MVRRLHNRVNTKSSEGIDSLPSEAISIQFATSTTPFGYSYDVPTFMYDSHVPEYDVEGDVDRRCLCSPRLGNVQIHRQRTGC
jgi:hypothetical protein